VGHSKAILKAEAGRAWLFFDDEDAKRKCRMIHASSFVLTQLRHLKRLLPSQLHRKQHR